MVLQKEGKSKVSGQSFAFSREEISFIWVCNLEKEIIFLASKSEQLTVGQTSPLSFSNLYRKVVRSLGSTIFCGLCITENVEASK